MPRKKKKSDAVVLPSEAELKFKPARGFGKRMNRVTERVNEKEIARQRASTGEPDRDMLRRVVK